MWITAAFFAVLFLGLLFIFFTIYLEELDKGIDGYALPWLILSAINYLAAFAVPAWVVTQ